MKLSTEIKMSQEQKLEIALARLEERVEAMQEDMKEMRDSVKDLKATANRWRGAFWLMMGLGGSIGVLSNLASGWMK
jgi:prophage DNA circulation protein|tara:strand:+ start:271 stop:501 length:231 start_codon:yes stop_codon:yes gene_type:complete